MGAFPEGISLAQVQANFWLMSVCFAANLGTVTTVVVLSSSTIGDSLANVGDGTLYGVTLLSALFVAAPVTSTLGLKRSLLLAMFFYSIYVAGFSLAAFFRVKTLKWSCVVAGSVCGGLAAGVVWTAQGGYFAASATKLAELRGESREAVTSDLAGKFASVLLAFEVGNKLIFAGLQQLHLATWLIGLVLFLFTALALLGMSRVYELSTHKQSMTTTTTTTLRTTTTRTTATTMTAKLGAVTSLWSDPIIWLLAPTNLTFGFCAAFIANFISVNYTKVELGGSLVGCLAAITAGTAAVLARLYGWVSIKVGKGPVICLGALCFLCIPLSLFVLNCCSGWDWWLLALYLVGGSCRAVYESTNRAMFSDAFTGPATEAAFANSQFQSSLSFAAGFFLQTVLAGETLAGIVLVLAALIPPCYGGAVLLRRRRDRKSREDLLASLEANSHTLA